MGGQQGQPVRIHQYRHIAGQDRGQPVPGLVIGAHARSNHPGLDPSRGVHVLAGRDVLPRHGDHRLRPEQPDHGHRWRRGHQPDHPGAAPDRTAHSQRGRTGEPLTAGHDPGHAPAVLVGIPAGLGQQRTHVRGLQRAGVRGIQVGAEADVDQLDHPGVPGAGVDQQAGFQGAERHSHIGLNRGSLDLAGIRVHPARQVHRDHHGRGARGQPGQRGLRLPKPAAAADAQQAVEDQVGRADGRGRGVVVRAGQAPARGAQRRGALLVHPRAGRDGQHRGPPAGQPGSCEERVATVVPAAREHHDSGTGNPPDQARTH